MRTLKFKSIKIKNFMSFGANPVELNFQTGLNLITGYNMDQPDLKNGIGKSSICDALMFALFDETIKKLNKSDIVNDINKKNCEVKLEFDIENNGATTEYVVERGISPSFCKFSIDKEDKTQGIPQTNALIKQSLGISQGLFQQSIIMSVGNSSSFFALKSQDKRAFIEGVFDLDIFSKMLGDARTGFNDSKKDFDVFDGQLTSEKNNLVALTERKDGFESAKADFISELVQQNTATSEKIEGMKKTIKSVPDSTEISSNILEKNKKLKALDDGIIAANVKVQTINSSISTTNREIKTLESIGDVCSKCNRPLDESEVLGRKQEILDKRESIKTNTEQVQAMTEKIQKVVTAKKNIQAEISELNNKLSSINGIKEQNKLINGHITTLERNIKTNLERIATKQAEICSFDSLIDKSNEKITTTTEKRNQSKKENSIFETCKFILSEEGVKSIIIKELKNFLNEKLNNYLIMMDAPVRCMFDEYFEETLYNQFNVEKSYYALSGGERRRLDMAVLFTLQDMLKCRSGIDVQLSFYDEILDTSIDESGRKKILEILKEKSKTSAIYVISHRSKMSELIDTEIVLVKHNEFTQIKDTTHE
jgi:DNA repair exonuclease SbcCD ATPase subunit